MLVDELIVLIFLLFFQYFLYTFFLQKWLFYENLKIESLGPSILFKVQY